MTIAKRGFERRLEKTFIELNEYICTYEPTNRTCEKCRIDLHNQQIYVIALLTFYFQAKITKIEILSVYTAFTAKEHNNTVTQTFTAVSETFSHTYTLSHNKRWKWIPRAPLFIFYAIDQIETFLKFLGCRDYRTRNLRKLLHLVRCIENERASHSSLIL